MPVSRLALTDFRSYASAIAEPGPGFVLLFGENGAGKTNLLEAVSLLAPGRGLRGAPLSEMARANGAGGFAVAARLDGTDIGTGAQQAAPERRQVRVNEAPASVNSLSEWGYPGVLWLTPAMDRLFAGSAGERRRFLDRLVLALEPGHAHHATRYDAAMCAHGTSCWPRTDRMNRGSRRLSWRWPSMGWQSPKRAAARHRPRGRTGERSGREFARASIALAGWDEAELAVALRANRVRDAAAGRATEGPHRQDLVVTHRAKQMPAAQSSTGEQKALLLGLILAHADLVTERRGNPPILLLDEVAAHLDPVRRAALFGRLEGRGQVWMTATEEALFHGIAAASRFRVEPGAISAA